MGNYAEIICFLHLWMLVRLYGAAFNHLMTKIVAKIRIYQASKAQTWHNAEKASIDDRSQHIDDKPDRVWQVQA